MMNDARIRKFVDDIFAGSVDSAALREQKEELAAHLLEKTKENISGGIDFDRAFEMACADMGDITDLAAAFGAKPAPDAPDYPNANTIAGDPALHNLAKNYALHEIADALQDTDKHRRKKRKKRKGRHFRIKTGGLAPIAVFTYIGLGIAGIVPGWWAWGWVIIPMTAALFGPRSVRIMRRLVAVSPFVYFLLGYFLGWWAWGWLIIPGTAILSSVIEI